MRSYLPTRDRSLVVAIVLATAMAMPAAPADAPAPVVHALENATFFFRAQDGTVLTLLMVQLLADRARGGHDTQTGETTYGGIAYVQETGRGGAELSGASARSVPIELAPDNSTGARATFFGRVYLQSGRSYTVRYVVQDPAREEMFLKNVVVSVPYLTGGFSVSSVVPAKKYGPASPGAGTFRIGSEEVVPKAGGEFHRSEKLRLYLQVYDARIDPESGRRRVDLLYRFYRSNNGRSKRYGAPFSVRGAAEPSMGLAFPIDDWPPGSYRVVVELHDRNSAGRVTTEGSFSIADE